MQDIIEVLTQILCNHPKEEIWVYFYMGQQDQGDNSKWVLETGGQKFSEVVQTPERRITQ